MKNVDWDKVSDECVADINTAFADYGIVIVRLALLDRRKKLEDAIAEFEFRYGDLDIKK